MMDVKHANTKAFVMMPISDPEGYASGHFARVYEYIIKPACLECKLDCLRADDVKSTNYIVVDILRRILDSHLVICDLSSRNPNVLYELGIRQAFNLPVVLLKDGMTDRVFDIQGLRTLEYDETLRVDTVQRDVKGLVTVINKTMEGDPADVNSVLQLLKVRKAELTNSTDLSAETSILLNAIQDISVRLTRIEDASSYSFRETAPLPPPMRRTRFHLPNGEEAHRGDALYAKHSHGKLPLGMLWHVNSDGVQVKTDDLVGFIVPPDDDAYYLLTTKKDETT